MNDFISFAHDAELLESTHSVFQRHARWWSYEQADGMTVMNVSMMLRMRDSLDMGWIRRHDVETRNQRWWHYGPYYHIYTQKCWGDLNILMRASTEDKEFFSNALSYLRRFER